jgi:phage replication-related protein YjqB (UPF0714/DUF867 family)
LEAESAEPVADLQTGGGLTAIPLVVSGTVADPEAVTLPAEVREAVGVEPGQQIRVLADADYAAYTVRAQASDGDSADPADESAARVSPAGADRFRGWGGCFDAHLDTQVVKPDLSRTTAEERGEYTEGVVAGNDRLAACAPHGGFVEPGTGPQARQVAETTGATAWYTAGYRSGGGAYDRWHISSTDMHRASYPRLDSIADSGFDRAVAFHGWSESGVGIGGLAPESERVELRDRIAEETPLDASLVREGEYAGNTESNVVNRLTADGRSGVQLEQSRRAREEFGAAVAEIVAELFG